MFHRRPTGHCIFRARTIWKFLSTDSMSPAKKETHRPSLWREQIPSRFLFRIVDGIKTGIFSARWTTMTTKGFGDRPPWKWTAVKVKSQAGRCAAESRLTLPQLENGANRRTQKTHRHFIARLSPPLRLEKAARIRFCASIITGFHA